MIRVELPAHLRTLARVDREVQLEVEGQVTLGSALDALETAYPGLRGTIPPDTPLPDAVARGVEPLVIIGAIAGG